MQTSRMIEIDKSITEAVQIAAKYPSILRMGVFGSYARGEETQQSDVDILYDYDDSMMNDMFSCLDDIQKRIKKKIDFIAYYLLFEEDNDTDEYALNFRRNALNDVIWIYEKE